MLPSGTSESARELCVKKDDLIYEMLDKKVYGTHNITSYFCVYISDKMLSSLSIFIDNIVFEHPLLYTSWPM